MHWKSCKTLYNDAGSWFSSLNKCNWNEVAQRLGHCWCQRAAYESRISYEQSYQGCYSVLQEIRRPHNVRSYCADELGCGTFSCYSKKLHVLPLLTIHNHNRGWAWKEALSIKFLVLKHPHIYCRSIDYLSLGKERCPISGNKTQRGITPFFSPFLKINIFLKINMFTVGRAASDLRGAGQALLAPFQGSLSHHCLPSDISRFSPQIDWIFPREALNLFFDAQDEGV